MSSIPAISILAYSFSMFTSPKGIRYDGRMDVISRMTGLALSEIEGLD